MTTMTTNAAGVSINGKLKYKLATKNVLTNIIIYYNYALIFVFEKKEPSRGPL